MWIFLEEIEMGPQQWGYYFCNRHRNIEILLRRCYSLRKCNIVGRYNVAPLRQKPWNRETVNSLGKLLFPEEMGVGPQGGGTKSPRGGGTKSVYLK